MYCPCELMLPRSRTLVRMLIEQRPNNIAPGFARGEAPSRRENVLARVLSRGVRGVPRAMSLVCIHTYIYVYIHIYVYELKERHLDFLKAEIHYFHISEQLKNHQIQTKISQFEENMKLHNCSTVPTAFWDRKNISLHFHILIDSMKMTFLLRHDLVK